MWASLREDCVDCDPLFLAEINSGAWFSITTPSSRNKVTLILLFIDFYFYEVFIGFGFLFVFVFMSEIEYDGFIR